MLEDPLEERAGAVAVLRVVFAVGAGQRVVIAEGRFADGDACGNGDGGQT